MKLYTLDCGWYGSLVVIAENKEEAIHIMKNVNDFSIEGDESKIEEHPLVRGLVVEFDGDR